jgi:hypothetical protein
MSVTLTILAAVATIATALTINIVADEISAIRQTERELEWLDDYHQPNQVKNLASITEEQNQ